MAISAMTSVLTANEWQYAKDIKPGDWVFNRLGQPVRVKTTQMYRAEDCYRVLFDDYLSIDGDKHLAFPSENQSYRKRVSRYKGVRKRIAQPTVRSVTKMLDTGLVFRKSRLFFSVPTTEPIQLPHQPLGIPPFLYGFWFFARRNNSFMQVPVCYAENVMQKFKDSGYKVTEMRQLKPEVRRFCTEPSIWDQLKGRQTRTLPLLYLNGSPEQRFELFQGIFSAKRINVLSKQGYFTIKTRKKYIIMAIQYLAESLGAKTKLIDNTASNYYQLDIHRWQPLLPKATTSKPTPHLARRYVKSIEPIPAQLCVHIETDDSDGSYLAGEGFIACH